LSYYTDKLKEESQEGRKTEVGRRSIYAYFLAGIKQLMPEASHVYRKNAKKNHVTPAGVIYDHSGFVCYNHVNPPG